MTTAILASKTYEHKPQTAPNPAGFCDVYDPSDNGDSPFTTASRWLMIPDGGAQYVNLRLAGVKLTPNVVTGSSGDMTMAANGVLTSTTSGKFSTIAIGDPVTVAGFTNKGNNGTFAVGPGSTATQLNLVAPGTMTLNGGSVTGGKAANTVSETPSGSSATVTGVPIQTQDVVRVLFQPGVMYPICADLAYQANTSASQVLCFY